MQKWNNKTTENLLEIILELETLDEAKKFFRDLLTEAELVEFGKRWQTARMLNGKVSYSEIEKKIGLSSTTITRVSKWLKKGTGGYKLMLNRLNHHHTSSSPKKGLC